MLLCSAPTPTGVSIFDAAGDDDDGDQELYEKLDEKSVGPSKCSFAWLASIDRPAEKERRGRRASEPRRRRRRRRRE